MTQLFEENIDGVIVIRVLGNLTLEGLAAVEAGFDALTRANAIRMVMDIGRVRTLTTPAISVMLRTARAVEARGGIMIFANATPEVRRIFACCRLDLVMHLVGDVAEGMKAAQSFVPRGTFPVPC